MTTAAVLLVVAGVCVAVGARPCEQHEKCVALAVCPSLRRLAAKGTALDADGKAALRAAQCGWAAGDAAMPEVCCPLLPLDECALPNPDRLLFSTTVRVFEAPWVVRLAYRSGKGSLEFGCSASLVTDLYLVTAAHCVVPRTPVSARLGELDTGTEQDCSDVAQDQLLCAAPALDVAVDTVIEHPGHAEHADGRNDIALVRLRRAVSFTDDVRPVCLPVDGVVVPPTRGHRFLVAHGWGTQANNGSAVMTKGQLVALTLEECATRLPAARRVDAALQQCTVPSHRSNACRGDPGGPLTGASVLTGSDSRAVESLVGVLSSEACDIGANDGVPTVSTRVAPFVPWILARLAENGSVH
ncbi:spaetzle-processing enzyme-like [Thrips palmi]|uniref:CLIP domain-containing serine protease n=1 Tax=Thrips palmi TaxID=161013 RepID=A0A6P8ZZL9_THRPL|nr:spaetzle-processing enzyme-like [Thrips palmi]